MTQQPEQAGDIAAAKLENLKDNSSSENSTPAETPASPPADDTPKTDDKQHGGAREGAGRPKGSENADTKSRRAALAAFKDRVATNVDKLFNSQLDMATGEKFLYCTITKNKGQKNESKETVMVTDPEVIKAYLDGQYDDQDDEYYFISTKAANNMAIDSLLNRAFGTPQKSIDLTSKGNSIVANMDEAELKRIATATSEALSGTDADD